MSREEDILKDLREQYDYGTSEWSDVRKEGRTDMRYVAGDPWDPVDRAAREKAGRPCLALDELGQYFNQTINDVRANPRAIKFTARGGGATEKTARFYADKAREIQYRSKANQVYVAAFENAVQRSYGFARIITKFGEKSFNQDIWLQAVPNPDLITPDPDAQRPDGLDQEWCFVEEWRTISSFKRQWPNAKVQDFTGETVKAAGNWMKGQKIRTAEYWRIEREAKKLLLLVPKAPAVVQPGQPPARPVELFEDELTDSVLAQFEVKKERMEDVPTVVQYLTNGVELLTPPGQKEPGTAWLGRYIPVVWCFGKVLYVDDGGGAKRVVQSMTRLARDPAMLYCYYRTAEAEVVGRVPKIPAVGYDGQFDGHEADWEASVHEPKAYLTVNPVTEATGTAVLPLPQVQNWEPPIQALELGAEAARRAIQAAMGISPLPTSALRRNEKSGKALERIEASQQKGSYHFVDSYLTMIEACGVVIEDLMDKIYDTARDVGIRGEDDTASIVRINDPTAKEFISTKGDHEVTVSTGPPSDSEREAASEFADSLVAIPAVFQQVADLIVKLKNLGPLGDQIADRLTPPQYRQAAKDGKLDPQAMAQELAGAKQQLAELSQAASAMKQALETEQAKQSAALKKAEIDGKVQITLQKMKDATAIRVAEIGAATKGYIAEAGHAAAHEQQAGAAVHELETMAAQQAHEAGMAQLQHEQGLQAGQVQHQQALESGGQENQYALEQAEQQARMAPQPGQGEEPAAANAEAAQ